MPKQLLLAILAAGASRRLGKPKQLLKLANETLLHRQCCMALEAKLGTVVAILGCYAELCRESIADLPVEVVLNHDWQTGMSSSIRAAASLANSRGYEGLLILLVDQYLLESSDLQQISTTWQSNSTHVVVSISDDYQGPPVLFAANYFGELQKLHGDQGAKSLLHQLPVSVIQKVPVPRAVTDCDQAEDARALEVGTKT